MTELLGTRQSGWYLEVFNDSSSDIGKGLFVQHDVGTIDEIGGHPESGSETALFDIPSPAEPTLNVILAGANDALTLGVTMGIIKAQTRGAICIQGIVQCQSDGGTIVPTEVIGPDASSQADNGATFKAGISLETPAETAGTLFYCLIDCPGATSAGGFGGS